MKTTISPKLGLLFWLLEQSHLRIDLEQIISAYTKYEFFVCLIVQFCEQIQCSILKGPAYNFLLIDSCLYFLWSKEQVHQQLFRGPYTHKGVHKGYMEFIGPSDDDD